MAPCTGVLRPRAAAAAARYFVIEAIETSPRTGYAE